MSDGSNGHNNNNNNNQEQQHKTRVNSGKALGARSVSPAKRSAADMEEDVHRIPGSFVKDTYGEGTLHFDHAMADGTLNAGRRPVDEVMDSQETITNGALESERSSMTTDTVATSFESDRPPPYSATDAAKTSQQGNDAPSIDEQVQKVYELIQREQLDEGSRGYIISKKWIERVWSRSVEGLKDSSFPKEAREGEIGELDNSDIVPDGAFAEPILRDMGKQPFIPLKRGMQREEDYMIVPSEAYSLIVTWYGNKLLQKPIIRYAHDTAPAGALHPNVLYELDPPIITIRRIPQPHTDEDEKTSSAAALITKSSADKLRLMTEGRTLGQMSPDDAVQLVSSKSERFNNFLKRAKTAAGISHQHKVKVWKLLDQPKAVDNPATQQNGVLSPPDSRPTSPKGARAPRSKLVLDLDTFKKMEDGKDFELIDAKDETNNSNYNGKSDMSVYELFEDSTIALEEMMTGVGGGEFPSDSKKTNAKIAPHKRILDSKTGSAATSGRTSPAPPNGGGMMTRGRARRDGRTRGTVGLTNLGNTCYMNSALQCIRSVEELAIYFLSNHYKKEINANNPLGHNGAMAKKYAELLQSIYADNAGSSITPTAFRKTLGSIQPMFSGYGQQDSQEFLSFLVDALHEDLNRIDKKPYNENPDSDDKTVHDPQAIIDLGEIYRSNHRARNASVAMDLFSGFYKNTMECPVCDKISITFDPYSLITVQLPMESTFQHDVTFIPLRGRPVTHAIDIDKNASIKMLKEYIASKHPGVTADRLWMAEVYSHKIYKVFENSVTLGEASIQSNDYLFMFELDAVPSNPPSPAEKRAMYTFSSNKTEIVPEMEDEKADQFIVPIFSRQKSRNGHSWENILHPVYITVTREQAQDYEAILKKILIAVSRLTSRPILSELSNAVDPEAGPNVEMKDDAAGEENAQLSEHSVSSEDGYVNVSLDKTEGSSEAVTHPTNRLATAGDDRPVPKNFMEAEYFLAPGLRNTLFGVNYGVSENGGLHCSGMSSLKDSSINFMLDRVKSPPRRTSSSSEGQSTTSTGSGAPVNGAESDESDDMDKPDFTLGGESTMRTPGDSNGEMSDGDELPDDPFAQPVTRGGRRKEHGKRNRKQASYGRKGGKAGHQQKDSVGSAGSFRSRGQANRDFGRRAAEDDDNPYYIKLGEGIILDWYAEGVEAFFGGDAQDINDERGHFVSSQDGKNLPYFDDPEVNAKKQRRETRKKHGITLDDCFADTGKREVLSEDNAWYCGRCKELRRARKTLEIWTIPDILVVHLKRFGGNRSFRDKIDVFVDYPIEGLDMTERVGLKEDGKEYLYDLFAVDNHYGGLGGGHYTALAKNFYDGQWYDYNDSSCSKVNGTDRLHSAAAYLLFYRRRSEKPLGPPDLQDLVMEARNPHSDPSEDSDSGEGRLGGPTSSLLGSSSALVVAGAVVGAGPSNQRSAGNGSAGSNNSIINNNNSSPITRTTSHHEHAIGMHHNGEPIYGPQRPGHMKFGDQGSSWSFNDLDGDAGDSQEAAATLISEFDDGAQDDDDGASTDAMPDVHMDEDDNGLEDTAMSDGATQFVTTPLGSEPEFLQDDHSMYSDTRGGYGYFNDAGGMGNETDREPETVNIYPDSLPLPELEHDEMD